MLDGRIDTQGTVKDLRAQGILDDIIHEEAIELHNEESVAASDAHVDSAVEVGTSVELITPTKKPRKLVKAESREHGAVKWSIYNTYLEASCVYSVSILLICANNQIIRSYWTWVALGFLVLIIQVLLSGVQSVLFNY